MQVNNSKAKQIAKWTNWLFTDHRLVDENHNFFNNAKLFAKAYH